MQPRCQQYRGGVAYERAVDILKRRVDEERLVLVVLLARVLRYLLLEELCAHVNPGKPNRRLSVVQLGSICCPSDRLEAPAGNASRQGGRELSPVKMKML